MIKDDINLLSEDDIYSMSLFMLYSLTEIPDYRTLSELPYLMDKNSLLNFCKYYGGTTIKVPTTEELTTILHMLHLYRLIKIEHKGFEESFTAMGYKVQDKKLLQIYKRVSEVLDKYEFKHREKTK